MSAPRNDTMLAALEFLQGHEQIYAAMTLSADDETLDVYRTEILDRIRSQIAGGKPDISSDDGARMALRTALVSGTFIDAFTHTLVFQTLAYLEGRVAS